MINENIDFLTIGDIAVDVFIKISDVEEICDTEDHCKLCFRFGDKIPYESAETCYATGNSANVAVSLTRLGLRTALLSYVGDDFNGKESINTLTRNNVGTDHIKILNELQTNYHYVLWHDTERTILVNHTEFPYLFPGDLVTPKWVYLSSLAPNSEKYHGQILKYLKSNPNVKLVFQPGTFQIKLGKEKLKDVYKRAEIFLCNKEEAKKILETDEKDHLNLMKMLKQLGPQIVVLTDGMRGSFTFDGTNAWQTKPFPHTPYERTGAGDAFSAAFVVAIFLGKTIEEGLMWGSANAMSVVSQVGPQKGLSTRKQIENYLKNVSKDYKPTKLE